MTISFPSFVPLSTLAEKSARELEPRIGGFSAEMVSTRALGQRLVAAGSAASPDAAAQQVLGVVAALTGNTDEAQAKNFAAQMGKSLVQVAEEGWNTAQDRSELKRFSLDLSTVTVPFDAPAKRGPTTEQPRRTAAPACGA